MPLVNLEDIKKQEEVLGRNITPMELWQILLADTITSTIAKRGYKEHKLYGQVVLGECVTREAVNETVTTVVQYFNEWQQAALKHISDAQIHEWRLLSNVVQQYAEESNKHWLFRRASKIKKLAAQRDIITERRSALLAAYSLIDNLKPKIYSDESNNN
jgi:hypothetical protein